MFLKRKCTGRIKARGFADAHPRREYISKDESSGAHHIYLCYSSIMSYWYNWKVNSLHSWYSWSIPTIGLVRRPTSISMFYMHDGGYDTKNRSIICQLCHIFYQREINNILCQTQQSCVWYTTWRHIVLLKVKQWTISSMGLSDQPLWQVHLQQNDRW